VVKSESFDGTLPVRRAAADIAAHGVDTRGVRGTAVVTAVVDVQLAVIALETCNKPAAATTSRSIALLPMYARTPAASRSRSAVAPRPINYGTKSRASKVPGVKSMSYFFILVAYAAFNILSSAIGPKWPQKGSCSLEKVSMLGHCLGRWRSLISMIA